MSFGKIFAGRKKKIAGDSWLLDTQWLNDNVKQWRKEYAAGEPFPHIVLDGFVGPDLVKRVADAFSEGEQAWRQMDAYTEQGELVSYKKKDSADILSMDPLSRQLLWELNSKPFLQFLTKLTGIPRIISDPLFHGGGFHEIPPGGLLKIHVDFEKHPIYKLDRRLNLILYLNEGWKDEYGGCLELWDQDASKCVQKILPIAGRCVIFTTSKHSFHGHPEPLRCPPDMTRKSLAFYYYTNGTDDGPIDPTAPTIWRGDV